MIKPVAEIKVGLDFGPGIQPVGRLAIRNGVIYFQYDENFLSEGFEGNHCQCISVQVSGTGITGDWFLLI